MNRKVLELKTLLPEPYPDNHFTFYMAIPEKGNIARAKLHSMIAVHGKVKVN